MPSRSRSLSLVTAALVAGCAKQNYISSNAPLGRVVVYRSGVAFYERHAVVDDGRLTVRVPRDRVDDFLKSLTVVDAVSRKALPITIPRQQADDGEGTYLTMALQTPKRRRADVLLTYVTESPAWKPSYRVVVGGAGKVMLEGWAVVDNTSGEDWKNVRVGVGASSALSFRYDLWSVRTIDREQLAAEERFAVAPPTGVSPYGGANKPQVGEEVVELGGEEVRSGYDADYGRAYAGASSAENVYAVEGTNTTGLTYGSTSPSTSTPAPPRGSMRGVVRDAKSGEPLAGATVVATSPALVGEQVVITDDKGNYTIPGLPPGTYKITFFFQDLQLNRTGVAVKKDKQAVVNQKIDTSKASAGERIEITGKAPMIDQGSTKVGTSITEHYTGNIPAPGRTFSGAIGSSAGAQSDPHAAARPRPEDKLKAVVEKLKQRRADLVIEAHADASRGPAERRARERANNIKNQLVDAGIAPARIKIETKVGAGETERVRLVLAEPGKAAAPEAGKAGGAKPAGPVEDTPVGESHFLAELPMDVSAGTSAMVSLVRAETKGGVVYLYDPLSERGNRRYAFRAVRLENPTDDTLEPGPVTVYGKGRFIGEGLTEPVPPRSTAVVPFALDRQLVVEPTVEIKDEIARLVTLERGVLTAEVQHLRRTHLVVTSRLHQPTTLYVRHRVEPGWRLTEAPKSSTRAGDARLFAVEIPAGATREVVIAEATPLERTLQLATPQALDMLEVYVSSPIPDPALKKGLVDLLATHRAIADHIQRIETLRDQLAEYKQRGNELHAQILSLKAVKTGGELMRVLKAKMIETSDRVQRATIGIVSAQEKLLVERTKFANQLAELKLPDAMRTGLGSR